MNGKYEFSDMDCILLTTGFPLFNTMSREARDSGLIGYRNRWLDLNGDGVGVSLTGGRFAGSGGLRHCRFVSFEFAERQSFGSPSAKL